MNTGQPALKSRQRNTLRDTLSRSSDHGSFLREGIQPHSNALYFLGNEENPCSRDMFSHMCKWEQRWQFSVATLWGGGREWGAGQTSNCF